MQNLKEIFSKSADSLKSKSKGFNLDKIKALLPKEKPHVSVGLDIGSFFIKAAALKIEKNKSELVNFVVKQIDKITITDLLSEIFKGLHVENKTINISVAGQGVVVRCIQMPKMSSSEAKNSLGFEAEKYIPFPLNEVFLDCFILKQLPETNKMLVLVAAAKKNVVQQRLNLLKQVEIHPNIIDIDSLALANIINRIEFNTSSEPAESEGETTKKKKVIALLNMGASFSSLCIVENGLPKFVRDIFIGGNDLTKRISNVLGVSVIESEKAKCNPSSDWEKVIGACETIVNNLINETRLSFDYFESESNAPIGSLYLSGGGSYLKGVDEIFKKNLNVETKILNPLADLNISEELDIEGLKSQAQKLSVAIGLALRTK